MWPVGEMGRNQAPVLGVETVGAIETGAKEIEGTGFGLEQMRGMGRDRKPGGGQISVQGKKPYQRREHRWWREAGSQT